MRISRWPWMVVAVCACGGGGGGGGGGSGPPTGPPGPPPTAATVAMGAQAFLPNQTTVATGGTVTWNNTSGVLHNVTFAAATGVPADIPDHASGSNQRTFAVAGAFDYQCTLHVGMTGRVTVQ
jgi:plastocyanin